MSRVARRRRGTETIRGSVAPDLQPASAKHPHAVGGPRDRSLRPPGDDDVEVQGNGMTMSGHPVTDLHATGLLRHARIPIGARPVCAVEAVGFGDLSAPAD